MMPYSRLSSRIILLLPVFLLFLLFDLIVGVPGGQQAENGVNNTNNNNNYSWYFLRQLNGQPAMPNYEKPSQPDNSTK
jgi:hypothetical protein